jgi:hypothetical protein
MTTQIKKIINVLADMIMKIINALVEMNPVLADMIIRKNLRKFQQISLPFLPVLSNPWMQSAKN